MNVLNSWHRWITAACGAATLHAVSALDATAQGVRYTVAPAAIHFNWNDELGLADVTMWGGRVGATFGGLVSLEGYYFRRGQISTRLAETGLSGPGGVPLVDQTLDLQHYGIDLRFNLGGGRWYPFAIGGAGVLRFEPDAAPRFDEVVLKYGGGLAFELSPGLSGQVFVENNRFRGDRYRFAVPELTPFPADPAATVGRDHLSFGASLGIALGGNRDKDSRERWSLASIPIEPYVARLEYDDGTLGHQWFAGVRAGLDLGQYFGLRGYYLRGVDDGFDGTNPVQSYGAEAQFNFNRGLGPAPFLLAGVGRLDFMNGFVDRDGRSRSDRNLFIVGAGLGLRLSDQVRLNFTARDWISSDKDFDAVSDPGDLQHNLLLSGGIAFAIGRGRTKSEPDKERPSRDDRAEVDNARPGENDTLTTRDKGKVHRDRHTDSTSVSTRTATFPVPTEGEIYIRYGKVVDGRMTPNVVAAQPQTSDSAIRAIVSERLKQLGIDSVSVAGVKVADSIRVRADSARTAELIRQTILTMDRERAIAIRPLPPTTDTTIVQPSRAAAPMPLRRREPALYFGFNLDQPRQAVIGGIMDLTPSSSRSRFRFLPEVALAFGSGGTSLLAAANVGARLGSFTLGGTTIMPQARIGLGILTYSGTVRNGANTQGVLNITYGFATDLIKFGGLGHPLMTVEHQGLDLFDSNRLLVGLAWRY